MPFPIDTGKTQWKDMAGYGGCIFTDIVTALPKRQVVSPGLRNLVFWAGGWAFQSLPEDHIGKKLSSPKDFVKMKKERALWLCRAHEKPVWSASNATCTDLRPRRSWMGQSLQLLTPGPCPRPGTPLFRLKRRK